MGTILWRTAFGKWQIDFGKWRIDLGNVGIVYELQNVNEIEWRIFCQTMRAGNFSHGKQSLLKLTPVLVYNIIGFP
jgi:hypothetical protein